MLVICALADACSFACSFVSFNKFYVFSAEFFASVTTAAPTPVTTTYGTQIALQHSARSK